ncbi:carbohydrate ABC transporter permease [Paenibacillus xylanexedens]|uniref:carbohydrate ABC transporter permease n=1 Tax=Paenibacillus xylanexedens TaxID=528191 RepID=UPI001F1BEC13|nr:sugar ABC transporter permease [Paenibacillus xylanexedens]
MAIVFFIIFNSYNGILNQLLLKYHVISESISWLGAEHAMLTTIIIAIWGGCGQLYVVVHCGLQSIPEELYEAASLDGASEFQKLRNVTIPLLGPVLQMRLALSYVQGEEKGYIVIDNDTLQWTKEQK